ncbi:MAG: hypothetical protein KDB58_09665 [Solirubrobacterales bacterium]|mgnify:CR=1 FL=1|nr:hypothetical protein [Solirubrobacterales bacterium]MCB8970628.1 hypothetical protein [Thermoleophilales bacterium]MCO5326418.1 hypothetical protein [Solirubrobacterales bacterium]
MSAESAPPIEGGTVLAFLNEVAGGRKLLTAIRERVDAGAEHVALAVPQNQPVSGQIVDVDEVRDAALSRVEVTQQVLREFGIEATASIFDPVPPLALDDAVRAFQPSEILISALLESRFGWSRKDLIEWASDRFDAPVVHIPVRIDDDAIALDINHTLVVATQTVNAPDLIDRLIARNREGAHRYTFICPSSGDTPREEVVDRLAETLAALYRDEIDATGQPMSPEPFAAVSNAIEHYRVDDILVSTFAGQQSQWIEDGLLDQIADITDKPVEHFESGGGSAASDSRQPVAAGAERSES